AGRLERRWRPGEGLGEFGEAVVDFEVPGLVVAVLVQSAGDAVGDADVQQFVRAAEEAVEADGGGHGRGLRCGVGWGSGGGCGWCPTGPPPRKGGQWDVPLREAVTCGFVWRGTAGVSWISATVGEILWRLRWSGGVRPPAVDHGTPSWDSARSLVRSRRSGCGTGVGQSEVGQCVGQAGQSRCVTLSGLAVEGRPLVLVLAEDPGDGRLRQAECGLDVAVAHVLAEVPAVLADAAPGDLVGVGDGRPRPLPAAAQHDGPVALVALPAPVVDLAVLAEVDAELGPAKPA